MRFMIWMRTAWLFWIASGIPFTSRFGMVEVKMSPGAMTMTSQLAMASIASRLAAVVGSNFTLLIGLGDAESPVA